MESAIPSNVLPENFLTFKFSYNFIINKPTLTIIFLIFIFFYFIVSSVLYYHWSKYGMKSKGIILARNLFTFVSIVLLVFAGMSIYYF